METTHFDILANINMNPYFIKKNNGPTVALIDNVCCLWTFVTLDVITG